MGAGWGGVAGSLYARAEAQKLVVDGPDLYVAGTFTQTVELGNTRLTTAQSAEAKNPGNSDVFIAKLHDTEKAGRFVWAQRVGGPEDEGATALVLQDQHLGVSGYFFSDTLAIGTRRLANPPAAGLSAFFATLSLAH
ncbi:hypothetical protein [Hymenobacter volaticus]|uniref:Uncharacterized protein n=1 Tax=Hymenobacter volaticus TaxID=2932254 RepID=A0ABY4GF36_9BACT|nr:hypothetical protein [Hymenobacter volaticus]UOQ69553.1 hypothetical protein MUN86_28345 [Hymenobacter volaticus]